MEQHPKIVIVGGVAGGASAAARLRRLAERAQVVVLERGPYASFANCGLPYYLGGEIQDRSKLLVAGSGKLSGWLNLDVRTGCEAIGIDRAAKRVEIREAAGGRTYFESYDYLILSPGAMPLRPAPLLAKVGADHPRVLSLRNIPDVDRMKSVVDGGIRTAVMIGAGFIGLEVTEQLVRRGVRTDVVELLPQVMPPLDPEMVTPVHEALIQHGVNLHLADGVTELEALGEQSLRVRLKSGAELLTDLVILAIGVRPDSSLAAAAGLELNERGAIRVNAHMQTTDPAIYAVGDAVEVEDAVLGGKTQIPLAGPANRQGRLVADHVAALQELVPWNADSVRYRGSQGTSIVRVFELAVAMTGLSEKSLTRLGRQLHRDYEVVYVHPMHHADYYPGATRMTLKLLFERPTGRVLGAQAVGEEGVDKRIDVIAMAIQMRASVLDLEQSELCYSPQYGSAKDPVNQAGFQAGNVLREITRPITPSELNSLRQADPRSIVAIDVRSPPEFAAGHVEGAVHIPIEELRRRLAEIPRDRPLVTYCALGMRGYLSERILRQSGFTDVRNLTGGYRTWRQFFPGIQ